MGKQPTMGNQPKWTEQPGLLDKVDGQVLMMIILLFLILFLSYCAVPPADERHKIAYLTEEMQAALYGQKGEAHAEAASHETAKAEPEEPAVEEGVILMENPVYEKHTKGIVPFTHEKHYMDYGVSCGECHHDDMGAPLEDLSEGDDVIGCAECHTIGDRAPKDTPEAELFEYHAEMLHMNCIGCHKTWNDENGSKDAPTSCSKCHPR